MRRVLLRAAAWAAIGGAPAAVALSLAPGSAPASPLNKDKDSCQSDGRKDAAEELLGPWEENYAQLVQEAFTNTTGPAMLTIGDGHYNAMFFNFMAHVNRTAQEGALNFTVVNVALDPLGFEACQALKGQLSAIARTIEEEVREELGWLARLRSRLPGSPHALGRVVGTRVRTVGAELRCVGLGGWLPKSFLEHSEQAGVRGTRTCSYNMIIWTKPHILKAALQASKQGVLMVDTDVVVKKDIIAESLARLATRRGAAMVTGIENHADNKINTGTVFLKPGNMATSFLYAWIEQNSDFLNDDHGDQAALQAALDHNSFLKPYAVTYGEAVGQCSRPGTVATHYNCWANKLVPMKSQGDWDFSAQRTRERLGLLAFATPAVRLRHKIQAIKNAGDWLAGDAD